MHRIHFKALAVFLLTFSLFTSCSDNNKKKKEGIIGESIYRMHGESFFTLEEPKQIAISPYPWEDRFKGKHPKITKEFFRCKGSPLHPLKIVPKEGKEPLLFYDCGGTASHGLPLKEGKEFIYPCLIDILNYIQEKTGKKVRITCGHRCPAHNMYCDATPSNWGSKHMIGAEVDFYLEGMENDPNAVLAIIMEYYTKLFPDNKEYTDFKRYEQGGTGASTLPWFNKEIFIKLFKANEGRNFDNGHPYPYLSLQVRYDRESNSRVSFDNNASQNFRRY